jgi:transcriptional regulator, luxR family protein
VRVLLYTPSDILLNEWKEKITERDIDFASSTDEFLKKALNSDVACLDVSSLKDGAKDCVKEVLELNSDVKVFALAKEPNFSEGKEYLALGVKGYGNCHMLSTHFNDSLAAIAKGDVWLYPEFIQNMIWLMTKDSVLSKTSDVFESLTSKEKEICELVYKGFTNQDISENMGISIRTVKAHMSSIFEKVGVKDRVNLVLLIQNNS